MQLLPSALAKIISNIPIIVVLVTLIFSTPIAAYSQSFIVPNHQQRFAISQLVSFTKDKLKTTGVKGTEHKSTAGPSKGSNHLGSITPSPLLPAGISSTTGGISSNGSNNKVVIINFDDSFKNQVLYAKPILDKYGFKATFFEVCGWIGKSSERKSWQDIAALQQDGMNIESHTMTHPHLNTLSPIELNAEIGGAKQCFLEHGLNPTIFAYPYSEGWNNPAVVSTVARYYSLARTDTGFPVTFLHCDGWKTHPQTDCRTYSSDGKLTFANRYSIKSWTHRHIDGPYSSSQEGSVCAGVCHSYDNSQMLQVFIADVNSQLKFNQGGIIRAIPIVIYHNFVTYPDVSFSKDAADTTINLFDQEMKYLHDTGFRVLTMANLGYDTNTNSLYINGNS
jgi:peptidoglycan/xylan/chitin deacetylase (PgdA/CDA1 family)